MSYYEFRGQINHPVTKRAAFTARALRAAHRRVAIARTRADRNPSEENQLTVTELVTGLNRLEALVAA
jgi:hypothetical protein